MKKKFEDKIKAAGFEPDVAYHQHSIWSRSYDAFVKRKGEIIAHWDGHYFVKEEGAPNSKERMMASFDEFIKSLPQ